MFWHEVYKIAYSVHIMFSVIFAKFITICALSRLFLTNHDLIAIGNYSHLFRKLVYLSCAIDHDALCS